MSRSRYALPPLPETDAPLANVRSAAWGLTLSGIIPFVGLALLAAFGRHVADWIGQPALGLQLGWWAALALALYAAVILSFLGGIRFGMGVAASADGGYGPAWARRDLAISVLPSLAGWALAIAATLGLFSGFTIIAAGALAGLAFCIVLQWLWDRAAAGGPAPHWFGPLRTGVTLIVVPALLLGAWATASVISPG